MPSADNTSLKSKPFQFVHPAGADKGRYKVYQQSKARYFWQG
jgi:hypothetical protein